jgi:hypothetical protein
MTTTTERPAFVEGPKLDYYSFDTIYSYNGVYNFVCGARGLGKTFGIKDKVIQQGIELGWQFIYVRRYKDELKKSRDTFFADIQHKYPNYDFRVNGEKAEYATSEDRGEKKREWKVIGYFIPLSVAQSVKSVAYPLVRTIIYDEFIIEKGHTHYLPNEASAFNNFFNTVDRYKDKTRVFFLANAVSIENPYFLEFDIEPSKMNKKRFITKEDNFIVCHFPDSASFKQGVMNTRFGKFIQGTEYADYAVGNEFADNHNEMLGYKPSNARYDYSIETRNGTFSVWTDWEGPTYYIQKKLPKQQTTYTTEITRMGEGKTYIDPNDKMLQYLRTAFRHGMTRFDTANTRNAFIQIFKR